MRKDSFILLFTAELLLAMACMGLLMSDLQEFSYLIAAVIFGAVLTPFFIKLKKTEEEEKKAKIRRNILLVMLTPIAVAFAVILVVVIALMAIA